MMTTPNDNTPIERPDWLPADIWPHEIRTMTLGGSRIAYTDEGSGDVLLLVHDGLWSFVWGQLIAELKDDFRVVTLDFPGSGLSPSDGRRTSIATDSYLIEEFTGGLGLTDATFVLHDLGGTVGMGLAARRPKLAKGLVLINTFAWPARQRSLRAMFRVMTSPMVRMINVGTNLIPRLTSGKAGIGRHLGQQSRAGFLGGFDDRSARRRFHDLMGSVREETAYLEGLEAALTAQLQNIPALTIFGERNDPFGFQERFAGYLADVEQTVVARGNHFPMCDDPSGVAHRIADWHSRKVMSSASTGGVGM